LDLGTPVPKYVLWSEKEDEEAIEGNVIVLTPPVAMYKNSWESGRLWFSNETRS
jgi:hypothetical protein